MTLREGQRTLIMPYRGDVFRPGHYYHLYNRGVGGTIIFFNPGNYEYCLQLIGGYSRRHGASVIAHCLMPNHYHLLIRQETDTPLSTFIRVLFNSYVQAVNKQQGRKGPLFEGRFRHVWVDREEYLIHVCRYIHLNPVRARLVKTPEEWKYSNYLECIGERAGTLKDDSFIRDRFPAAGTYRSFVTEYLDEPSPADEVQGYLLE